MEHVFLKIKAVPMRLKIFLILHKVWGSNGCKGKFINLVAKFFQMLTVKQVPSLWQDVIPQINVCSKRSDKKEYDLPPHL
jgi:hypothetical protein